MKWVSSFKHPAGLCCEIVHDSKAGYYLFIYDVPKNETQDHLQDTLEIAQEQALEDFGIPLDSWKEVE